MFYRIRIHHDKTHYKGLGSVKTKPTLKPTKSQVITHYLGWVMVLQKPGHDMNKKVGWIFKKIELAPL